MNSTELNYVKSEEHTKLASLCYDQAQMIAYITTLLKRIDSQTIEMFLILVDIKTDLVEDWEIVRPIYEAVLREDLHTMPFVCYTKAIAFVSLVEHKLNISPKTYGHG